MERDIDNFFLFKGFFFVYRDLPTVAMAAATDKARFFLEQSVPELKEYEKKKIFSKVTYGSLFCPFREYKKEELTLFSCHFA